MSAFHPEAAGVIPKSIYPPLACRSKPESRRTPPASSEKRSKRRLSPRPETLPVRGVPSLTFPALGTQTQILSPDLAVGLKTFSIINIIDSKGCIGNISNTIDILVNELPNIHVTISGTNPICFGDISELSFPVLAGLAPINLSLLEGATSNTLTIDALGLIGGQPYQVSPKLLINDRLR